MQAVSFPGPGRVEIIEIPRPALIEPTDAIVLVTTAAIGPWDIERFQSVGSENVVPGGEFAGLVVETGSEVRSVELDDLVSNTVHHRSKQGQSGLFGTLSLPGGHAEYVRVPDADSALTKIPPSGEERAVLAGGTIGLGVNAAATAMIEKPAAACSVVGCDPIGMSALIALKSAGNCDQLLAVEDHVARKTLASKFATTVTSSDGDLPLNSSELVIVGAIGEQTRPDIATKLVKPGGTIVFAEPYGPSRTVTAGSGLPEGVTIVAASWPTNEDARKIVNAMQIRKLDFTALVSHVIPLDEAVDAYVAASEPGPGVQKVLIKP